MSPRILVADVDFNVDNIIAEAKRLNAEGVEIAVFPELCVTGYTCGDLFHSEALLRAADRGVRQIAAAIRELNIHLIIGTPVRKGDAVYNCAVLIRGEKIDYIEKSYLPNYNEFYEHRWFTPASSNNDIPQVFESHGALIGIEICEDLWVPIPPSCRTAMSGAQVIFNLSASNDIIGKHNYLVSLVKQQSARCLCAYAYASAGFGESTTDVVFLPKAIIAECGSILTENNRNDFLQPASVIADVDIEAIVRDRVHTTTFVECARNSGCTATMINDIASYADYSADFELKYRNIDPHPFIPEDDHIIDERCAEITALQECGLARRLKAVGSNNIVVGISGGLDSTLALLVAVNTVRRLGGNVADIVGVTMPGFGTTDRTFDNAIRLMSLLGITHREISIANAVNLHFKDIGHNPNNHDVTYENSQARERTQLLMDIANQIGGIVLGTGDLSELALGWATYNGDHMSMYGVNSGVPKTLVRYLVRWYAAKTQDELLQNTLLDIIDTPISPELTPADGDGNIKQKTEELVGPYELHDFFLYYMLRYGFSPRRIYFLACNAFRNSYDNVTILRWLRTFYYRFFTQQFKRSCLPDGPKIGSVCLSPRGDWRMPSDAVWTIWKTELDTMSR